MTLSNAELSDLVKASFPNAQCMILDSAFVLPKRELVEKSHTHFRNWLFGYGLTTWIAEKFDCDKWAILYKAHCILRNAVTQKKNALPVGLFLYYKDGKLLNGHAINVIAIREDNETKLVALEPQPNGGIIELTQEEKTWAWFVLF